MSPRLASPARPWLAAFAAAMLTPAALSATIRVPADYPTIMDAVNAASSGDLIEVDPGVPVNRINMSGKTLTIVGMGDEPGDVLIGQFVGSAITVWDGAVLTLRNVRVTDGGGIPFGGGIDVRDSVLTLEDVIIDESQASNGGAFALDNASAVVRRTVLRNNVGYNFDGSSAIHMVDSTLLLEDSLIFGHGGLSSPITPVIDITGGSATIRRTRIWDNETGDEAIIRASLNANVEVSNVVIDGNASSQIAEVADLTATMELRNVTIVDNDTTVAQLTAGAGTLLFTNSILDGDESVPAATGPVDARYSMIDGGGISGPGVIDAAPIFKPLSFYQLDAGSPGIDAADSGAGFPDPDFLFEPRLVDDENIPDTGVGPSTTLDMGALERRAAIRYVDAAATGAGTGMSWDDAITDLQDAIEDATFGDVEEIWIAAGSYRPDRGTGDRNMSFEMQDNLLILGGYEGSETQRGMRDPSEHVTILGGGIGDQGTIDDNSFHVVRADGVGLTGVLSGVVIQRGAANSDVFEGFGGGLLILGGGPIIDDVVIRQNIASSFGSAVFSLDASPRFNRVQVNRNGWQGASSGTMVFDGGSPTLINVQVNGNRNAALAAVQMRNLEGAMLSNLTIVGNETEGEVAGINIRPGSEAEVVNTIVWANVPANPPAGQSLAQDNAVGIGSLARFTTVEGWPLLADGNNGLEPTFVDGAGPDGNYGTADDDLRLAPGSCLIDAGDNSGIPFFVTRDLEGVGRFLDDPGTVDSGVGNGAIVDRGAHEFAGSSCAGDVDGNGEVSFDDLLEVLADWGPCPSCPADVNCDDMVDFTDLLTVLAAWGPCPG